MANHLYGVLDIRGSGGVAAVPEELRTGARIIPAVGQRGSIVYVL